MRGPGSSDTRPDASSGHTCMPNAASTPSSAPSSIMSRAPIPTSSEGWKRTFTVPRSSCRFAARIFAAVSSIAMWLSCPQACMTPGFSLAKGSPVASVIGSASISDRRRIVFPGRSPLIVPSVPWGRLFPQLRHSIPSASSSARIAAEVFSSFPLSSGCA